MRSKILTLSKGFGAAAFVLALFVAASAQFRAGLQGTISDTNGAGVPGATVTLKNKDTNQSQAIVTNADGFYRFSSLAPGSYSITVEKDSFTKSLVEDITVDAESVKGQDVVIHAGSISETVTIEADAVTLQTEDARIGKTLTTEEVQRLPQVGRDPYELIRLTPGVVGLGARGGDGGSIGLPNTSGKAGSNTGIFQTENMPPISANGQRGSSNNYQIDGVSVNSQNWGGSAIITPSQEIVKEIQVTTSNYSAEDGRNSGAQIKTITQNGTNDWHGSAFYKYNDPTLNSYNKMPYRIGVVNFEGPRRVERKFRSYGGSFGGQLPFFNFGDSGEGSIFRSGRDKSWFYVAYEGFRDNTNVPYYSWIETEGLLNSILTQRSGTTSAAIISAARGTPRTLESVQPRLNSADRWACGPTDNILLNDFNGGTAGNGGDLIGNGIDFGSIYGSYGTYTTNNNIGAGPDEIADVQCALLPNERKSNGKQIFARVDFQITDAAKLAITGTFTPTLAGGMNSDSQSRPQSDFFSRRKNFATAAIYNHTFSPTALNEFRFSYSGWGFNEVESNPDANFGMPRVEIEGIWGGRLRWGVPQPGTFKDRQYNLRDTFTNILGNHVLKIGGEYSRDVNAGGNLSLARPLFGFVRPWNFANGTPVNEVIGTNLTGKPTPDDTIYHTTGLAFFVQDDWKMRPNLTLNLGLRWEYLGPIVADRNVISNLVLDSSGGLAGAVIEAQESLTDRNWNNFAPQVGFAWSPERFGNKLVVRGGTGIAYDRLANALLNNARRNPGAPSLNFGICCPGSNGAQFNQMNFAISQDGSIYGYPVHPLLGGGSVGPNGLPLSGTVEIYGAPRDLPNASVWRYSLEAQYELPWRTVATFGYTGTRGRKFVRIEPVHIVGPSTNTAIRAAYFARPDVKTNYNALLASLRTRFYKGLSLSANYTFGKSLDTSSWEAPDGATNQTYPIDQDEEYGRSDFDTRHNFNIAAVWDIPFYSNQRSWKGKILGGWQMSTVVTYNTGYPWTPRTGGCLLGTTTVNFCDPRPIGYDGTAPLSNTNDNFMSGGLFPGSYLSGTTCNNQGAGNNIPGCNTVFLTDFDVNNPLANRPAVGRNSFFGPKYFVTDISVGKKFGLPNTGFWGEAANLDIKVNFFNVFNQLNFAPFAANSNPTHVDRAQFGMPTNALSGRVGEFQARFSF